VRLMGGNLSVDSELGRGSSIYFTVEVGAVDADESEQLSKAGAAPAPERACRVLLAEDEPINRFAIRRMLERLGHEAHCVENGLEVLDVVRGARFDLIIMDIQMPVMDGLEAARRLREDDDERLRTMPIVAVTAYAMKGDRERILAAGMDGYLSKPVDMEELRGIIQRATTGRGEPQGLSSTEKKAGCSSAVATPAKKTES